ncbi:MAG: DUF4238 domain-containing protein, partial [Bacillota bacterium]|nr:DUF4238 domain-containing protein [Bacillota bacterium]
YKALVHGLLSGKTLNEARISHLAQLSAEEETLAHLGTMFAFPQILELVSKLKARHWWFAVTDEDLLTSDHPVTRWSPFADPSTGLPGYGVPQTRFYYPLEPHIAVVISSVTKDRDTIADSYALRTGPELTRHMNELQVLNSYRYVYARDAASLLLAREMCVVDPELRKPKKQRIDLQL